MSSLSTKHAGGGTLQWTSPEIFESERPINTSSSDIYSFACVSYEIFFVPIGPPPVSHSIDFQIFSGLVPFHEMHDSAIILQVIRGRRPSRPSICEPWNKACEDLGLDDETWALIDKCWDQNTEKRPAAKEAGAFLCAKLGPSRNSQLNKSQNAVGRSSPWDILESIYATPMTCPSFRSTIFFWPNLNA